MFKKENTPPTKQGVFYQLDLNKNNGPFLSKDIMYNNPISNTLLPNQSILKQHKKMIETMISLEKNAKMKTIDESKTENFTTIFKFCDEQLAKCEETSSYLEVQQKKFKKDIEMLYDKVSNMNNTLLQSSMPVLKNLMKKVKESNQTDKAQYYKIQKELQSIQMQKRTLEHIILNCKHRIQDLENVFGTSPEVTNGTFFTSTHNFFD